VRFPHQTTKITIMHRHPLDILTGSFELNREHPCTAGGATGRPFVPPGSDVRTGTAFGQVLARPKATVLSMND